MSRMALLRWSTAAPRDLQRSQGQDRARPVQCPWIALGFCGVTGGGGPAGARPFARPATRGCQLLAASITGKCARAHVHAKYVVGWVKVIFLLFPRCRTSRWDVSTPVARPVQ